MIDISNETVKIIVDADACPVKTEIVAAARQYGADVLMVASYAHQLTPEEGVTVIQVDRSDQSVDMFIANRIGANDILVTQDFGLATIGLAKRAIVISNRGQLYTDRTIDFLLETRHDQAKKRRGGHHTKGPRAFTDDDRSRFLQTLTKVLRKMQEI